MQNLCDNKEGKFHLKLVSFAITFLVIAIIVFAGPANALSVSITGFSVGDPIRGEETTTTANINIQANERIKLDKPVKVKVNNNVICEFDPLTGVAIVGCEGMTIQVNNIASNYGYGYGYGYGEPYGYGYNQGYSDSGLSYNITINSSEMEIGNNEVEVEVDAGDGHVYDSNTQNVDVNMSETQQHATNPITVIEDDTSEIIMDSSSSAVSEIQIPSTIASNKEIKLNFNNLVQNNQITFTNQLSFSRQGTNNYNVLFPAGTTVSGTTWNGQMILPTVKTNSDYSIAHGNINVVIELGTSEELTFNQPVKVVLGNQAGKSAAWTHGTTLNEITALCDSATSPTNIDPVTIRECAIDSGDDLIIWTYHFTSFASYTPEGQASIPLYEGWNLISLPFIVSDSSLPNVLSSIAGNYDIVWAYKASDSTDQWKSFVPVLPSEYNDLTTMEPEYGYWIKMTQNDTLIVQEASD
jgi:hypothetical protein